jgi:hypothetical protein
MPVLPILSINCAPGSGRIVTHASLCQIFASTWCWQHNAWMMPGSSDRSKTQHK